MCSRGLALAVPMEAVTGMREGGGHLVGGREGTRGHGGTVRRPVALGMSHLASAGCLLPGTLSQTGQEHL